jgi:two-component system, NarL family, nitrate/nitrite response regulator NarL
VISDIRLYREGLCEILSQREGIEVAGAAADVDSALPVIRELVAEPDVVLLDIGAPDGLLALRELASTVPGVRILAITVPDRDSDVVACAESGAAGFVTRGASLEQLVDALESVARGEVLCSPRITAALVQRVGMLARERAGEGQLTQREREILTLIDAGFSNKSIAQRLSIEVPTVKNHVHRIIEKMGVTNRAQAAARFRRQLA